MAPGYPGIHGLVWVSTNFGVAKYIRLREVRIANVHVARSGDGGAKFFIRQDLESAEKRE